MLHSTDIDIDILDRDQAVAALPCVRAIEDKQGEVKVHASGFYFQAMPFDAATGLAVFDYKQAKDLGYFKIDLLSSSIYAGVTSEDHLEALLARPVDWSLFEHRDLVKDLFHIGNYFGIVQAIRPESIEDLAVILALIRSSKRHLLGLPREQIDREIWKTSEDGYTFKRAHAIAYAHTIVVQANLMYEQMETQLNAQR